MKKADLIEIGEAYERLSENPDYKFLLRGIQSQIQIVSTQIIQGNFKEFPKDYWKAVGELKGLARGECLIQATVKVMNDCKKEEEKRAKE